MAGRPPGRDWRALKDEFITGDESMSALCRKHAIPLRSMRHHSSREQWWLERERYRTRAAEERHRKIMEATIAATMPSLLEVDLNYVAHVKESCDRLERCVVRLEAKGKLGLPEMQRVEAIHSEMYLNLRTACGAEFARAPETKPESRIDNMTDDEVMAELERLRVLDGWTPPAHD